MSTFFPEKCPRTRFASSRLFSCLVALVDLLYAVGNCQSQTFPFLNTNVFYHNDRLKYENMSGQEIGKQIQVIMKGKNSNQMSKICPPIFNQQFKQLFRMYGENFKRAFNNLKAYRI